MMAPTGPPNAIISLEISKKPMPTAPEKAIPIQRSDVYVCSKAKGYGLPVI